MDQVEIWEIHVTSGFGLRPSSRQLGRMLSHKPGRHHLKYTCHPNYMRSVGSMLWVVVFLELHRSGCCGYWLLFGRVVTCGV